MLRLLYIAGGCGLLAPATTASTEDTCTPLPLGKIPVGQWPTTQEKCDRCTRAARAAWTKDHGYVQWPCEAKLCGCTGGPVPSPPVTPSPPPAPATSKPSPLPAPVRGNLHYDAAKTRFVGRWYSTEADGMTAAWGARTFHLRFTGSTAISVMLTSPVVESPVKYYVCSVDGGESVRLPHSGTKKALLIKTGLIASATHDVTCSRSNEASYGETVFYGAILDEGGALLDANAGVDTNQLRYEAIGDSITAGFKVYIQPGENPSVENEDVMAAYERHLADYWGTDDWRVVARSGVPVRPNSFANEDIVANYKCRQYVHKYNNNQCPGAWDFSSWTADVVTINLGTNDVAFAAYGPPTHPEFDNAYYNFVALVREKYGPNTLIVAINPLVYGCELGSNYATVMKSGIENTVKHFNDNGDDLVRLVNTGGFDSKDKGQWLDCTTEYAGDQTHPTAAGHEHFAELLAAKITPMIREVFPDKCGGTGIRCE